MNLYIGNDWDVFIEREKQKEYFSKLMGFIDEEYRINTIFPPEDDVFNALKTTPLSNIKVVILGQDPYHEKGQAHGFSFSVKEGVKIPRSLANIYKELSTEFGKEPKNGIQHWSEQGVLLLNTVLTVREGDANSHAGKGWETFTDNIILEIEKNDNPIVYMLWGKNAGEKKSLITNKNHLVLETTHPSPFSARKGFLGCNHFIKANKFLLNNQIPIIEWV